MSPACNDEAGHFLRSDAQPIRSAVKLQVNSRVTTAQIHRLAREVVAAANPQLDVVAVIPAEGGSRYVEVMVVDTDCRAEPCRLVIGADRTRSEGEFRTAMSEQLERFERRRSG